MTQFENKVVWITGASSGIGEALAYTFARDKAKLVLSARRAKELERVKKECKLPEGHILLLPMDVSEHEKAETHYQEVIAKFGQVDILINNAGLSHWSKIKDLSLEVIQKVMNVNFLGGVALTKAVLPDMLNRKQGHIVVVSSILGKIVTPKQAAYNASKHAIQGFYDTLRAEAAPEGLKVLIVSPGAVNTDVAKNSLDREGKPINKSNKMIENGLDPGFVAEEIRKAIQKNKEEIILAGGKEKFAILMKRFAPGLFSRFLGGKKAS
ncbi:SDR family oxidoreductase [Nafulsella turpanensis]|uniref:SDR family oxidoreductase n=1 Tax=Nafulsella turpanensis TaxID=1265690 RepID=UPI00034613F0|nr:SDR family oxidoreductase [Nafulsella turpanensis]